MIHNIILSANEDPNYISFWPAVAYAYRSIFKDVEVHLAFLTNRSADDPYINELSDHGTVTVFRPLPDVSEFAQAKMIRFILASQLGEQVSYVDDIDLLPLSYKFITDKTGARPKGKLLAVGGEVYNNNGCYPVSQMTAEGWLWKQIINPHGLGYKELFDSWRGTSKVMFDQRENPDIKLDWAKDEYFSDERLIRRLRTITPVPVFEMQRGYRNFMEATVDRYDWKIDPVKLVNHVYVNAHGIRPYSFEKYKPLLDYIDHNYNR